MGVLQGRANLDGQVESFLPGHAPPVQDQLLEGFAVYVLHRVVDVFVLFARLEEADDAGMVELLENLDFTAKAAEEARIAGQLGSQDLDGRQAFAVSRLGRVVGQLMGQEDIAHAAAA